MANTPLFKSGVPVFVCGERMFVETEIVDEIVVPVEGADQACDTCPGSTPGAFVIDADGKHVVDSTGKIRVFDACGRCDECCGNPCAADHGCCKVGDCCFSDESVVRTTATFTSGSCTVINPPVTDSIPAFTVDPAGGATAGCGDWFTDNPDRWGISYSGGSWDARGGILSWDVAGGGEHEFVFDGLWSGDCCGTTATGLTGVYRIRDSGGTITCSDASATASVTVALLNNKCCVDGAGDCIKTDTHTECTAGVNECPGGGGGGAHPSMFGDWMTRLGMIAAMLQPGNFIAAWSSACGIKAVGGCGCNSLKTRMNRWGWIGTARWMLTRDGRAWLRSIPQRIIDADGVPTL